MTSIEEIEVPKFIPRGEWKLEYWQTHCTYPLTIKELEKLKDGKV